MLLRAIENKETLSMRDRTKSMKNMCKGKCLFEGHCHSWLIPMKKF